MRIAIVQTSDGVRYKSLLDAAEPANAAYAARHGYDYVRHDGVIRGCLPWHATFNRIYLVEKFLKEGKHDWLLYMDADAVVIDHQKPLTDLIEGYENVAFIGCRGMCDSEAVYWDVNIGVFLYNLKHPQMPCIVDLWKRIYESVPIDPQESGQSTFEHRGDHLNDQTMLQNIIAHCPPNIIRVLRGSEWNAMNYDGSFIRQILRDQGDMDKRVQDMKRVAAASIL